MHPNAVHYSRMRHNQIITNMADINSDSTYILKASKNATVYL